MHFNFYFLQFLSASLSERLVGKKLTDCYSQNKDELILQFHGHDGTFFIKASLHPDIGLLSFPESFKRAKKNSVDLFSQLKQRSVESLHQYKNERSFSLLFEDGFQLLFKLHGRQANICLFRNDQFLSMFKNNYRNDQNIQLCELNRSIDQSSKALLDPNLHIIDVFPTFDRNIKTYLENKNFEFLDKHDQIGIINDLLSELNRKEFYILKNQNNRPFISLLKGKNPPILETTDPILACNELSRQYFQVYLFDKEKDKQLRSITKTRLKDESYLKKAEKKLEETINGIKYDEIANIIMANLHLSRTTEDTIELFDFYRNNQIKIKLKKGLSLQANAELLYRKAKNQQIEIKKIRVTINERRDKIAMLMSSEKAILEAQNFKQLRSFKKSDSSIADKPTPISIPYYEFNVDNHIILVGKNAKSNDRLLKEYSSKEDIWLHARGFSGSHVIIKRPAANIAGSTIEKVAQITAWYSKGRNNSLCPVIHTRRKYVSKPKGALPGQVVVQREQVIIVNPCQNPQ